MAEALLWGRVDAVIYNEAFDGIIEETVEDYADNVRILYQYGIDTEIKQEETDIAKPFNVYISGIDVSGPITTNSRSDVNIIMTVNPTTKKILLTTTPRDFYVPYCIFILVMVMISHYVSCSSILLLMSVLLRRRYFRHCP